MGLGLSHAFKRRPPVVSERRSSSTPRRADCPIEVAAPQPCRFTGNGWCTGASGRTPDGRRSKLRRRNHAVSPETGGVRGPAGGRRTAGGRSCGAATMSFHRKRVVYGGQREGAGRPEVEVAAPQPCRFTGNGWCTGSRGRAPDGRRSKLRRRNHAVSPETGGVRGPEGGRRTAGGRSCGAATMSFHRKRVVYGVQREGVGRPEVEVAAPQPCRFTGNVWCTGSNRRWSEHPRRSPRLPALTPPSPCLLFAAPWPPPGSSPVPPGAIHGGGFRPANTRRPHSAVVTTPEAAADRGRLVQGAPS